MKTIYISGPMKNIPDGNMQAFDEAEKQLKQRGYEVINPHKKCEELNIRFFKIGKVPTYEDYLREDIIHMLEKCDAVLVLPGWRGSKGSKLEIANALACGIDVFLILHLYIRGNMNAGKQFEKDFKASVLDDQFFLRLKDAGGWSKSVDLRFTHSQLNIVTGKRSISWN